MKIFPLSVIAALAGVPYLTFAAETVVEDFTSVEALDTGRTSASWNTVLGTVTLGPTRPRFGESFSSSGPDHTVLSPGFDVPQAFILTDLTNDGLDDLFWITDFDSFYIVAEPGVALEASVPILLPESFDDRGTVVAGDIDLDGDVDVFVGIFDSFANQPSYFYLNTGDSFAPFLVSEKLPVGTTSDRIYDAKIADINGDKLPDLVVAELDSPVYFLNNGTETPFDAAGRGTIGNSQFQVLQVLVADFNGDALNDVVAVRSSGRSRLYLNNGTATPFSASAEGFELGTSPDTDRGAVADLNNDGFPDIVLSRFGEDDYIFINSGPQTLFNEPEIFRNNNFFASDRRAVGDFNVDGVIDFLTTSSSSSGSLYLSINDGTGRVYTTEQIEGFIGPFRTESFDYNGDSVADVLYSSGSQDDVIRVHLNKRDENPYGVGGAPVEFGVPAGITRDISVFDVDNDGDNDVVAAYDGNNVLYRNDGPPFFNAGVNVTADQDDTRAVATSDLNDDEFADVVAANMGINRWYPNDLGDGPFLRAASGIAIGTESVLSQDVAAGDLNGDGISDVVFANSGQNHVYYGDTVEQPFHAGSVAVSLGSASVNTRGVILVDFDGDGDLDIATANDGANSWYANDGSAQPFGPGSVALALGTEAESSNGIAAGDVDRDGLVDVVVANDGVNRWYRNTGDALVFDPSVDGVTLGAETVDSRAVSSIENAGGTEIVFVNADQSPAHLFRLLQPGDQAAAREIDLQNAGAASSSIASGDVNGDGAADLVLANILASDQVIFGTAEAANLAPNAGFNLLANRVQSLAVPGVSETVETVAIEPQEVVPGNTSIQYFVGTGPGPMQRVFPGRVVTLESPGPELYWRAQLSSLSPAVTPAIEQLTFFVNPEDSDADQIADFSDNCTLVANSDQLDTDADGFGNACDTDLNNDGITNFADLNLFSLVFFSATEAADFNGDGTVNFDDLSIMRDAFFGPPGPAGAL